MKKNNTKKAVASTTVVKVENEEKKNATEINENVAEQKTTPQTHITKDDPEWDDYIVGLKKNVEDAIDAGLFNWYLAYVGFIDSPEAGFADLFDGEKMFRILLSNGYCPECANNYIKEFRDEVDKDGKKKHYLVISREEQDFWNLESEYEERCQQAAVKHIKA